MRRLESEKKFKLKKFYKIKKKCQRKDEKIGYGGKSEEKKK